MKLRKDSFITYPGSKMESFIRSPLSIHIDQLCGFECEKKGLFLIADSMAHLNHLRLSIHLNKNSVTHFGSSQFIQFPRQLESLSIHFRYVRWGELDVVKNHVRKYIAECMKQIAAQSTRLLKLEIELGGFELHNHGLDFPYQLQSISTLTDLILPNHFDRTQQIDLVKSLPALRIWKILYAHCLYSEDIQRLVDGPSPPPKLEDITRLDTVDEAMASLLQRLPTLTKFRELTMTSVDPRPFLSSFPRLSILDVSCLHKCVDVNYLTMALSSCVTLTELTLTHAELTSHHFSVFLRHLISLVHLRLVSCPMVESLQFLTTSRESLKNLRRFEISSSTQIPAMEYDHLNAISSSLEHLMIWGSCLSQLDDSILARWTPSSPQFRRQEWPRLRSFVHRNTNGSPP